MADENKNPKPIIQNQSPDQLKVDQVQIQSEEQRTSDLNSSSDNQTEHIQASKDGVKIDATAILEQAGTFQSVSPPSPSDPTSKTKEAISTPPPSTPPSPSDQFESNQTSVPPTPSKIQNPSSSQPSSIRNSQSQSFGKSTQQGSILQKTNRLKRLQQIKQRMQNRPRSSRGEIPQKIKTKLSPNSRNIVPKAAKKLTPAARKTAVSAGRAISQGAKLAGRATVVAARGMATFVAATWEVWLALAAIAVLVILIIIAVKGVCSGKFGTIAWLGAQSTGICSSVEDTPTSNNQTTTTASTSPNNRTQQPGTAESESSTQTILNNLNNQVDGDPFSVNSLSRTSLAGLNQNMTDLLIALQKANGGEIVITGGTEAASHSAASNHPKGLAVDLRPNDSLSGTILNNSTPNGTIGGYPSYNLTIRGQTYRVIDERSNPNGSHWHIDTSI